MWLVSLVFYHNSDYSKIFNNLKMTKFTCIMKKSSLTLSFFFNIRLCFFQWDFQQLEDDLLNMHHGEECDDKELLLLYFLKHCQYCLINNWEIHFFTCKMKIAFSWSRKCYFCQFKHNIFSLFLTFNFDWNCVINLFLFHVHYFHQVQVLLWTCLFQYNIEALLLQKSF